jgi:16S rRNA (cytidine1402-2'-O)-methyltransferase
MGAMNEATKETAKPALSIVATPIGNLGDITLRALETLRQADVIACEDTRHARHLLDHHGIRAQLLALHEHNEQAAAEKLLDLLAAGKCVALISDAGTPGVSDPGARAVAAVRAAGYAVTPLPGPNAAVAALSAAGLDDPAFLFVGFLPAKVGARRTVIEGLKPVAATLVFYEAPHRIEETVADLVELLEPEREIVVARELTKLFEQIVRLPLPAAPAWLAADDNHRRGEFVLLVSAPPPRSGIAAEAERVLRLLLDDLPVKQAARLASEITGTAKNELYRKALEIKAAAAGDG